MLILTRRAGERIYIPEVNMWITVLSTQCGQTRLGFDAPQELTIFREEVYERQQAQNQKSN